MLRPLASLTQIATVVRLDHQALGLADCTWRVSQSLSPMRLRFAALVLAVFGAVTQGCQDENAIVLSMTGYEW